MLTQFFGHFLLFNKLQIYKKSIQETITETLGDFTGPTASVTPSHLREISKGRTNRDLGDIKGPTTSVTPAQLNKSTSSMIATFYFDVWIGHRTKFILLWNRAMSCCKCENVGTIPVFERIWSCPLVHWYKGSVHLTTTDVQWERQWEGSKLQ